MARQACLTESGGCPPTPTPTPCALPPLPATAAADDDTLPPPHALHASPPSLPASARRARLLRRSKAHR